MISSLVEFMTKCLVRKADKVVVEGSDRGGRIEVNVTVDQEDYGRLIGRNGQTINAIRTVAEAAGKRQGVSVAVEVVDGPRPPRSSD